jgi:hypothetical protein
MARSIVPLLVSAALVGCGGAETAVVPDRPTGTLVFVTGSNRLTAVDVATGRRTVRRVSALAACGPELYVTGGRVIFGGVRRSRTIVYSTPATLDRPPVRLGAAHAFVRSATDGRIWLAGVDCNRRRMAGVREVTVEGETTFSTDRRVPGQWIAGAVEDGLVLQRGRALVVWDPRTGTIARRLDLAAPIDARGSVLAGCAEYSTCSSIALLDARTAATVIARQGDGYRLEIGGRLSPDGSLLAAPANRGGRWSVALVDTRTGASSIVPGTTSRDYPELSWSAASGWLFIRGRGGRALAYRPGAARVVALGFRLPKRATAFVAG